MKHLVKHAIKTVAKNGDQVVKNGIDNGVEALTEGNLAKKLFVGTDADIDGTLEADAITVNGTALNTVIAGVTVANATTAAVATTVTISDNESTNEDNAIIFTAGGDDLSVKMWSIDINPIE